MTGLLFAVIARQINVDCEFVFADKDKSAKSVTVAGTFNGWNAGADPMTFSGGKWTKRISLPMGKHQYKFVINGSTWMVDSANPRSQDDGNGNINSLLFVLPASYSTPAKVGDGEVTAEVIQHVTKLPERGWRNGKLRLSISVRPGDIKSIEAVVNGKSHPLEVKDKDEFLEKHGGAFAEGKKPLSYWFRLKDGKKEYSFDASGLNPGPSRRPFTFDPSTQGQVQVPNWTEGSVFYQIFPDRFENGDRSNDPAGVVDWNSEPKYYNFFGGDFAGVKKRLSYLQDLGVNGVYFNPIFHGPSNHGYETTDYMKVDPRYGTNEEFVSLVKELRQKGIRTVLDGVFNHTSVDFQPFKSIREEGQNSKYKNWYFVKEYPVAPRESPPYEAWFGFPGMPKLNVKNPEVKSYFWNVLKFWESKAQIDGWRLDVANEVDMGFWREFRQTLRAQNKNRWIVGEVWGDGGPWLGGDQWDSVMGYQFRDAALNFFARNSWNATQLNNRLFTIFDSYAPEVSMNLMNLLGSHDTARWLTECGGRTDSAMLGFTLLLTWPGSPSIYYGDELGMDGGPDPANRDGMKWELNTPTNLFHSHIKKLIGLRKSIASLRSGEPIPVLADNDKDVFAFGRALKGSSTIVVISRSKNPQTLDIKIPEELQFSVNAQLRERLQSLAITRPRPGFVRLTIPPMSGAIISTP